MVHSYYFMCDSFLPFLKNSWKGTWWVLEMDDSYVINKDYYNICYNKYLVATIINIIIGIILFSDVYVDAV